MSDSSRPPSSLHGEPDPEATISAAPLGVAPAAVVSIQVEGYRLIEEVSRGGQAIVFSAIFLKTGRKVALKVMREGPLATEEGRARFTREVQILASLNHPNIVTILDRGRTGDGSEFFAMDFIDGPPMDEGTWKSAAYLQSIQTDPARPLQLFLKICDAVNAAHLRGIVHRDLKPSNIRLDDRGEPHVLDFGLARVSMLEGDQAGRGEPLTLTGQFLGTLPWASPEQAEGIGQKIDMRSDVYSLGVILYQLVTCGHFPYQVVGSMRDVLNNIMTAEPPAPSTIAAGREARDLKRHVRRVGMPAKLVDPTIDAIVLRALAKRRDDRYQSAGELARDIECHLAGRPTVANPSARAGHARKPIMLAAAAVLSIAVIGCVLYAFGRKSPEQSTMPPSAAGASGAASPPRAAETPSAVSHPMHPLVASSPLAAEYQEIERIMGQFVPASGYIQAHAADRYRAWRAAADNGDSVGQLFVARCYERGFVVPVDAVESERRLRLAADQGLPLAMCMMGIRYRVGTYRNYSLAMTWYRRAADAGDARAMTDLGVIYMQGLGTPVDFDKAMGWFRKSADLGAPAALSFIGDMYYVGNGVTRDYATAMSFYRRAADAGAPYGMNGVGVLYLNGRGIAQDFGQAMIWFRKADEAGAVWAAQEVGDLYANGQGVMQDFAEAAAWYRKGADAGVALAMRKLGALYEQGNGVPRDHVQAVEWYIKAAGAGDREARQWLASNGSSPSSMPGDGRTTIPTAP